MKIELWALEALVPSEILCMMAGVIAHLGWLFGIILFALVMGIPPIRRAYANGWRCILRHPALWKIPALFAGVYGIFDLAARALLQWRLARAIPLEMSFSHIEQETWMMAAMRSVLPASEQLASVFNCLVSTFPLSALSALLLLLNYRGLTGEISRSIRKKWKSTGWGLFAGILLCALAALLKPVSLLALPEISSYWSWKTTLPVLTLINALSFIFEYLVGTVLQLYLLLIAYSWIRGIGFDREKLFPFAVRRLRFVIPWSLLVISGTIVFVHIPLLVESLLTGNISWIAETAARTMLVVMMIVLGPVQVRLALHNDSLREALETNLRFLKSHGILYTIFLVTAFALLWALQTAAMFVRELIGNPFFSQVGMVIGQTFLAAVGGWLLAAWVCFYKGRESGFKEPAY